MTILPVFSRPKIKPKKWGSFSEVRQALFTNLKKIGIEPETCAMALPCWSTGNQINYGIKNITGVNSGVPYKNGSLYFDGVGYVSFSPPWASADDPEFFTAIAQNLHTQTNSIQQVATWAKNSSPYNGYGITITRSSGISYLNVYAGVWGNSVVNIPVNKNVVLAVKGRKAVDGWFKGSVEGEPFKTIHSKDMTTYLTAPTQNLYLGRYEGGDYLNGGYTNSYFLFKTEISDNQIAKIADNPNDFWKPIYTPSTISVLAEAIAKVDGKIIITGSTEEILNIDGKSTIKDEDTDLLDGKSFLIDSDTNLLDSKTTIKNSTTELIDGKLIITTANETTDNIDCKVIIKDITTSNLDSKVQIKDTTLNLLDGKLLIGTIQENKLDGKVQIKDIEITNIDGKITISSDDTNLFDGNVLIKENKTELFDGLITITDILNDTNLFDGKLITIGGVSTIDTIEYIMYINKGKQETLYINKNKNIDLIL